MNNLLKEAIADAKAVRETALANAKLALEEAFTPRLQSMLSAKLSEDEEMEMEEDEDMAAAEVPAEEPMEEPAPEAPVEAPVEEGEYEGEEEVSEEEELEAEPVAEEEEEDLELEAILRELEDEGEPEPEPVAEGEDEDAVEEQSDSSDIGKGDNKVDAADSGDEQDPGKGDLTEDEEVDLEEIINALREDEGEEEETVTEEDGYTAGVDDGAAADLEEAYKVIRFMKSKLNEVNLLNAKLLFSNKLFRNHNLNESQKMKVIENFDRAQSMREVKLVFATLTESFKFGRSNKVKTIKESYASRPTRTTRPNKSILSEGNTLANRWKKLAGLSK